MPKQWLPVRLLARVLIGVLVPLLGITWLVGSHDVTLQVDGQATALTTYARTVDELLDRAGVDYTAQDEIVPEPSTELRDGMVVEVVHAREITLLIGGEEETVLVTALSVDDVIDQFARRRNVTGRSIIRPSRLTAVTPGMTIEVLNPVGVTVVADGNTKQVVTDAATVGGVLQRLDLGLGRRDRVTPALDAGVQADMRIVVERVKVSRDTHSETVPYATEQRPTDDLETGETREIQAGRNGVDRVTERVTVVDGQEVSREVVARRTITAPQDRIVEVGTGTAPEPRRPAASPSRAAEPSAPAPEPKPEPEPEPEPAKTTGSREQTGEASYYHHPEEGLTAAHRTLPFGTVVTVTNLANGQSVDVTINDRGPYIDGRIIDLNDSAFRRIASVDSGVIDVRINW